MYGCQYKLQIRFVLYVYNTVAAMGNWNVKTVSKSVNYLSIYNFFGLICMVFKEFS